MKKKFLSSKDFLWLSLTLLIPLTLFFLLPVTPNDYWWYLRLGGEIAQTHAVPAIETFSYTQAGQPMVYHSWLAALLFFWVYELGGITLTVFLGGLLIARTYGLLWSMMREMGAGPRLAGLITLAAVLPGSINWAMRPQLFAYPLFAWSLWILWCWQQGTKRDLWALSLIALFWVNLHGSFVLLILLIGVGIVFGTGERKSLLFALGGVFLVTLVNPRGWHVWEYVVTSLITTSNQAFSREWMPPVNEGWQMNLFFAWILVFMAVAGLSSRKLSRVEWAWALGFGWLAFSGLRYGIWLLFILAPLSASLLVDWGNQRLDRRPQGGIPQMDIALGILFLLMPLSLLPGFRSAWWTQAPPVLSADTPIIATEWLREHPELPDPIWADLSFSSYMVYALPERPVWIDTRFEVYPPEHWENYEAVNNASWNWESLLDADQINVLMLSQMAQDELINAVNASEDWCQLHQDEQANIYARMDAGDFCP